MCKTPSSYRYSGNFFSKYNQNLNRRAGFSKRLLRCFSKAHLTSHGILTIFWDNNFGNYSHILKRICSVFILLKLLVLCSEKKVQFNNKYWQVFEGKHSKYYLYAAYLDIRSRNKFPRVRINGFIEKDQGKTKLYTNMKS